MDFQFLDGAVPQYTQTTLISKTKYSKRPLLVAKKHELYLLQTQR